ncbi:MAG: response regulator [Lentimonas sp.]
MAYSVLILDDDTDFNSLLTDIFEQADYAVTPLEDPLEAVDVFRENHFDLVVVDHRMPRMTGAEFMKVIKKIKPEVPVIMVSGYLENDTIRELISEGVRGVFLKPLNIFSLLERIAELIEEAKKYQRGNDGNTDASASSVEANNSNLRFKFESFPCKAAASIRFAERLYELRNFKSTLSVVGEPGANFRAICDDIRGFDDSHVDSFIYLTPDIFDEANTIALILKAQKSGADTVTCVLLEFAKMSNMQRALAAELAKVEGVFDNCEMALRTIFCVNGDLDTLFDSGVIDESLYILMGTAEVHAPSLNECSHDVPVIAQQLLVSIAAAKSVEVVPQLERCAIEFLLRHPLSGDYQQLVAALTSIVLAGRSDRLTAQTLKVALGEVSTSTPREGALAYLNDQRVDYTRAALKLFSGNSANVARFFGADVAKVEGVLKYKR